MSQCGEEDEDVPSRSGGPEPSDADRDSASQSCVSLHSRISKDLPLQFQQTQPISQDSASQSCVSLHSRVSKDLPLRFQQTQPISQDSASQSCVSLHSRVSKDIPLQFQQTQPISQVQQEQPEAASADPTDLDSMFQSLQETFFSFVKKELQKLRELASADCSEDEDEDEDEDWDPGDGQRKSSREAFQLIALRLLRRQKHVELAKHLEKKTSGGKCRLKLKSNLKKRFQYVFEGIAEAGNSSQLNQIYTELFVTEGEAAELNREHEVMQIEKASRKVATPETVIRCEDLFNHSPGREAPTRLVITKGVAGIGKTLLTQKFVLNWAEGGSNQNIHFTFPFTFRELNLLRDRRFSLVGLVHHFFPETKRAGICRFDEFQVLFIFDGLDECRLPLDFHDAEILTDVTESSSVEILLANLIRGKLLPSARLWITTRPAAAHQIPPQAVDVVTEVRGFTDPQKDEYFRKRFKEDEVYNRVISHVKTLRSIHIMCHIPVFCWISATVLEEMLKSSKVQELPRTLTRMYIQFLVVQSKHKTIKYDGGAQPDQHWSPDSQRMVASLGKLAFEQLLKGNIYFYRSDLRECGIEVKAASVYSGVFTQILQEESLLYLDKVFAFVHLSVQEFFAALHVHMTFVNTGVNLLADQNSASLLFKLFRSSPLSFYQSAIDKALQSPNGRLDLFLRFLLGLSLPENQAHLRGLVAQTGDSLTNQRTAEYIKMKINENPSPERSINLFHCLKELKDSSLVEEIEKCLRSGSFSIEKPSPAHWSALVFILLSSDEALDSLDLKKYSTSEEALHKLLPVVKASTKAVLSHCNLSERSCEALASVLGSQSCSLKELDLSNNDLQDSGVKRLCEGLQSPHCGLQSLSLSGCQITKKGCASLVSVLSSNPRLKDLDLTYNCPGDTAKNKLSNGRNDPTWGLETLRIDPGGAQFLKPGLRKYARQLLLDPKTANRKLILSGNSRRVNVVKDRQPYPDHPERFDYWKQLLCTEALSARCYWEVEWAGQVYVAVTYRGIKRKGEGNDSCLGMNEQSWSLHCCDGGYSVLPGNTFVPVSQPASGRVGVYLDWPAGTLSFFKVLPDTRVHLHTFHTAFTEPVYPAFRIRIEPFCSSLALCDVYTPGRTTPQ